MTLLVPSEPAFDSAPIVPPCIPVEARNRRLLIIDDNREIHHDYRKILAPPESVELDAVEAAMFGDPVSPPADTSFQLDSAYQGLEGVEMLCRALKEGRRYAMAFVDIRMPPGIDGIETAMRLWKEDPDLQVVICTAYSEHSWTEAIARLGNRDRLLILKKPFDNIEVLQLAFALTEKWHLSQQARHRMSDLEDRVRERTCELVAANSKLREQAALLDKAQDAIMVWNLDGAIQFWNKSAERLYGWTVAETLGRTVGDLFPSNDLSFAKARQKVLEKGAWIGELVHPTKDRREITVEGHWTLVRDEDGKPSSVLAINTDITARKKLEAQFLRAQRMESIGTLAGGIAHDLNNVLSPIIMAVELLKMKCDDARNLDVLDTVETNARRGADMVRHVLSFARGVEGDRSLLQPLHLIRDIRKIATDTFPKNIDLKISAERDLWNITGDATQIHQVLLNLCVNARDAMPTGGQIVLAAANASLDENYVTMNPDAAVGPYVIIEVRDTGTGISRELLEKIFDPFFTTKEFGKGTGLGLSTSLGIVKSHGGFIQVESRVGAGSSFKIYLPAEAGTKPEAEGSPRNSLPRGKGEQLLIVDDEAPIRKVAQQTLEAFGYRVIAVSDGAEAIAIYAQRQNEIDAIVTDMMMPVMDGPAMIEILTRIDPEVRIVAVSGLKEGDEASKAGGSVKCFLPKPYTADALLRALATVFGRE